MRIYKTALMLILVLCMVVQTSFAASVVTLYGKTDSTEDITILLLKEGADVNNIKNTDIAYVSQEKVNDDGSFVLTLPLGSLEGLTVRSNKNFDVFSGERDKKLYVSAALGNDDNSGESADSPLKTLTAAYKKLFMASEIIVMDDMALELPGTANEGFVLKGNTASVKLTLPAEVNLTGNLYIDDVTLVDASTIYANGFKLKIGSGVTSADTSKRLTVYGGKKNDSLTGNTDIELLGGYYANVYGGGYCGTINGNTKVVLGGNANINDSIKDNDSNFSKCRVFGGGHYASVTGKTDVTLSGNAVAAYVYGAGEVCKADAGQADCVVETNVNITGGKVMNVYGGACYMALSQCNTNITMTGGVAEALFGGSISIGMNGSTNITVKGGEVTRRIYTGCYNDYTISGWVSNYYVTGTTNFMLYPGVNLSLNYDSNRGVFSGSRMKAKQNAEKNTIIYMDDCYNSFSSKTGEQGWITVCDSYHDYIVKANAGGDVYGTTTGGTIKIVPDAGYKGKVSGINTEYLTEGLATLASNTATVTFERAADYQVNDLTASKGDGSVSGSADIMGSDAANEPKLVVAVYDKATGMMLACSAQNAGTSGNKSFNLNCNLESGKKYIVKAMIWDSEIKPLTSWYEIEL